MRGPLKPFHAVISVSFQGLRKATGGSQYRYGVQSTRYPTHPIQRSGNADCRDDFVCRSADRGADRGHSLLALGHALGPTAPSHGREGGWGKCRFPDASVDALWVFPGEEYLSGRTSGHRQDRTNRHGVAQTCQPFRGRDADPPFPLSSVDLGTFVRRVSQLVQDGPGAGNQPILARRPCQLRKTWAQHITARDVSTHQSVMLQRRGQAMNGGSGQSRCSHQPSQAQRAAL